MIEVEKLTKNYGPVNAIRDVSFSVAPGDIVGFLGPNGAGKSTTMRILACFMPASSGSARVAGYDVFKESLEVRKRIGYLPENVPLYADMRVGAYLDFVAEVSMVCSGVMIINKGAIVAQGPIDTLVEQFFPTARVHVQIAGPYAAVLDGLRGMTGVLDVHDAGPHDGAATFVVESDRARDVRGEIFQLAAQQKWELRELRRAGMTLEEVFIRIVAGEETVADDRPAAEPTPAAAEAMPAEEATE